MKLAKTNDKKKKGANLVLMGIEHQLPLRAAFTSNPWLEGLPRLPPDIYDFNPLLRRRRIEEDALRFNLGK